MRDLSIDTMTTDSFKYLKLVRLGLACFVFWPYHAEVPGDWEGQHKILTHSSAKESKASLN